MSTNPLSGCVGRVITEGEVKPHARHARQLAVRCWAAACFGETETTSVEQRGIRLLEEAIEAYQAAGASEAMAHELVRYVFQRPKGELAQELGGVAVTTLLLAEAAGVDADDAECKEIARVLSKSPQEFAARNAAKNAAGFERRPKCSCTTEHGDSACERHPCNHDDPDAPCRWRDDYPCPVHATSAVM
jgi:NTP pyrophosphatase (non-canonical NTP hydrolase)